MRPVSVPRGDAAGVGIASTEQGAERIAAQRALGNRHTVEELALFGRNITNKKAIIGGIDDGETPGQAAMRELKPAFDGDNGAMWRGIGCNALALSLITGQIGRPGTGLHPLRGQNNVQGASDAGLIPMFLPDYQPVGRTDHRGEQDKVPDALQLQLRTLGRRRRVRRARHRHGEASVHVGHAAAGDALRSRAAHRGARLAARVDQPVDRGDRETDRVAEASRRVSERTKAAMALKSAAWSIGLARKALKSPSASPASPSASGSTSATTRRPSSP